jgi:predicted nucleic acid-binding protein
MQKLFVDTNIVIDLLSKREMFYEEAQKLFSLSSEEDNVILYVSVLTFANTNYLLSKHYSEEKTRIILKKLKNLVKVVQFDDHILSASLVSNFKDFEDAIQYYSAITIGADFIISRNKKDFKTSQIPVLTAKEYLNSAPTPE